MLVATSAIELMT